MAKFVRGPFTSIDEVKNALDRLHKEGYSSQDLTVVANSKKDLDSLEATSANIAREDVDSLEYKDNKSYWDKITNSFSGFFFNDNIAGGTTGMGVGTGDSPVIGYVPTPERKPVPEMSDENHEIEDEDPKEILATFKDELEDGKIVILVEDTQNIDAKFNLDAIDDHKVSKDIPSVDEEEINADPSQVMNETITERDSHPDIENDEEVLEQETTYVPTDSGINKETNRDHPTL